MADSASLQFTGKAAEMMGLGAADTGTPQPPGRWLIDNANPGRPVFYWDGPALARPDPPSSMQGMTPGDALPPAFKVASRDARAPRGVTLLYEYNDYVERFKPGSGRAPSDNYNPFGRFSTGTSTFRPNAQMMGSAGQATLEKLQANDKTFKPIIGVPHGATQTPLGNPAAVIVQGGQVLDLVQETPFGAVYGEDPGAGGKAAYDPGQAKPLLTTLPPRSDTVKQVKRLDITANEIQAWSGRERSVAQGVVMGASAGDAAENAGFARNEGAGWEWLHLIAHSMGGAEVVGPQVDANLVAGTSECNTQMIVVEEMIKAYVTQNNGRAVLVVFCKMFDPARHIGQRIVYDCEFHNAADEPVEVFHWEFDALSRQNPMAMQNRALRYASREAFPEGGQAATGYQPRSQPTAHSTPDPAANIMVEQQTAVALAALNGKGPEEAAQWIAQAEHDLGHPLDDFTYHDIVDQIPWDAMPAFVDAIGRLVGAAQAHHVVESVNGDLQDRIAKAVMRLDPESVVGILNTAFSQLGPALVDPFVFNVIGENTTRDAAGHWIALVGGEDSEAGRRVLAGLPG